MVNITSKISALYRYDEKNYVISNRKSLNLGDIFYDTRCCNFKMVETDHDLFNMSFVDPELYYILEEVQAQ